MKMKKIYKILLLIAVCIIVVSGCKKEDKVSGTRIYYTDSEGVSLVEKGTRIKRKTLILRAFSFFTTCDQSCG